MGHQVETSSYDAGNRWLLRGNGSGEFTLVDGRASGLHARGNVSDARSLNVGEHHTWSIASVDGIAGVRSRAIARPEDGIPGSLTTSSSCWKLNRVGRGRVRTAQRLPLHFLTVPSSSIRAWQALLP